jgi:hypothetical protein
MDAFMSKAVKLRVKKLNNNQMYIITSIISPNDMTQKKY